MIVGVHVDMCRVVSHEGGPLPLTLKAIRVPGTRRRYPRRVFFGVKVLTRFVTFSLSLKRV